MDASTFQHYAKNYVWDLVLHALNDTLLEKTPYLDEGGYLNDTYLLISGLCNKTTTVEGLTLVLKTNCLDVQFLTKDFKYRNVVIKSQGRVLATVLNNSLEVKATIGQQQHSNGQTIPTLAIDSVDLKLSNTTAFKIITNQVEYIIQQFQVDFEDTLAQQLLAGLDEKLKTRFQKQLTARLFEGVRVYDKNLYLDMNLVSVNVGAKSCGSMMFAGVFTKDRSPASP